MKEEKETNKRDEKYTFDIIVDIYNNIMLAIKQYNMISRENTNKYVGHVITFSFLQMDWAPVCTAIYKSLLTFS